MEFLKTSGAFLFYNHAARLCLESAKVIFCVSMVWLDFNEKDHWLERIDLQWGGE